MNTCFHDPAVCGMCMSPFASEEEISDSQSCPDRRGGHEFRHANSPVSPVVKAPSFATLHAPGRKVLATGVTELKLDSMERVDNLKTLKEIVLKLEEVAAEANR